MLIHRSKMAASSSVSLTEELFQVTRLNQYKDSIQAIHPGEGIAEKTFPSSVHGAKLELDNRLKYKVNKVRKGKTTKTKKVINPNLMFTVFTTFAERSPGEVRKDIIDWIEENRESFKLHTFMGMASRDMSFDTWFNNIRSNDYIRDEFCLSALCQMCQRHALVVTSVQVWTTIPASFQKTDDEIRRLCDIHLLYVCKDTYSVLKPVFEWKREMQIGEIDLVTPPEPLDETTEVVLARESNEQNTIEIKEETSEIPVEGDEEQDPFGLVDIPPLPDTPHPLPDATVNRLVELPGVNYNDPSMDATVTVPTINLEGEPMDATIPPKNSSNVTETKNPTDVLLPVQNMATVIPCLIVLQDVSIKLQGKTSVLFPPTEEEMCKAKVCLQWIDQPSGNQPQLRGRKRERTHHNRLAQRAKDNVKYVFTDATSGEDTIPSQKQKTSNKSAPSVYRLAAHQYMVAKKKGLIEEPRTRTRVLQFTKVAQTNSTDSKATLDYMSDNAPPPRKRRRRQKIVSKGKLITKSFVLRKSGKGTQTPTKQLTAKKENMFFQVHKVQQTL